MSYVLHTHGPLFIVRWQEPLASDLPSVLAAFDAFVGESARLPIFVSLVDDGTSTPDERYRSESMKALNELVGRTRSCYVVLAATGFRAAVYRAVIAWMTLLPGARPPFHFVRSIEEVLENERAWIGGDPSVVLAQLRALGVSDRANG